MVTRMPTAYAATTVRGPRTSDWPDRSRPKLANSARSPTAISTPRPSPTVEPSTPSTNDSSCTERVTWRREAPSARSRASSRLRWATRIENVLTIRNEPTTSEMPAKISRKIVRKLIASSRSVACSSAWTSPVTASKPSGIAAATSARSCSWLTPSAAVTQMVLNASWPPRKSSWARGVVNVAKVEPLSEPPSGKPAMPTRVGSRLAVSSEVMIGTRSPISQPDFSAVLASRTTSSGPSGSWPSVTVRPWSPLPAGASDQLPPNEGGPKPPIGLPASSTT